MRISRFPLVCAALIAAGCGDLHPQLTVVEQDQVGGAPTWVEFLRRTYQEPESGVFIVDGDIPIPNEKLLREFYEQHVQSGQLIVHRSGGADAKWSDTQKLNLTYCVSTGFGTRYPQVVGAMQEAAAAWEAAARVKFIHLSAQDDGCTASNANVLFDVRPVSTNQYLARAFFPGQSRSTRNVLIATSAFGITSPTLTGVLRHELGHTLGFRHEHTRPESGTCFEDSSWRQLTPYDSASVMHYPQCNGSGGNALVLTALDQQGAAALYGAPQQNTGGSTPTPTPTPTPSGANQNTTLSGTVARGEWKQFPAFAVQPGSNFLVQMSGSGDPDLYVRFGSAPSSQSYHCRPYLDGATERCELTVPAGVTSAYVGVYGYTAGAFTLAVEWTEVDAPPTPAPTVAQRNVDFSGAVARGATAQLPALTVAAGTRLTVTLSGSGDPDLYVRFGSAPTLTSFACRPYLNGPNESCELTVPAGQSTAHLMVHGYSAATYVVKASYFN